MHDQPFHHTLMVREDLCRGCTHCMKRCPTEAIRITGGKAKVDPERCVDCGQCMDACPHDAIVIEQNDFNQIYQYTHRVAIIPSLMIGQFEDSVSESDMIEALHKIGFTHVHYAEFGVDILKTLGNRISVYADDHPVVSSYCPAVVRLIQLRYPTLLPHVNLMRTPAQITALYARADLEEQGIASSDIGIFYITPCAAKYAQIKTPGSATEGLIQGGLNLDSVFNLMQGYLAQRSDRVHGTKKIWESPTITGPAFLWSLTKGESSSMQGRTLSIDEIHNVIEFLELVEDERHENIDFLELRACDTGCTGGILTARNRFLATERIKHHAQTLANELDNATKDKILSLSSQLIHNLKVDRIVAKKSLQLDVDVSLAIKKMEKIRRITEVLPGIDCGLCGSPTCKALAEDIARSNASIRRCLVLKMKDPHGLNNLAKIWGEAVPQQQSPTTEA
ncbi:[Fe-Fe] hydrogenase large subunit C-terminal domain-containing protein [Pleomorphochaeta sp. DL1XJH-081]|uniref:[Fe-Fe] hydrogenase large subunit C-terminal domain-containing protein n=1 Tax=Pleomorphochaeta sp. DL1XJH-081 TaxID=3409690 RepID=UPI003BB61B4E